MYILAIVISYFHQITRYEEKYKYDMLVLENDLYDLEATVERLRGQAANRFKWRFNF